MWACKIIQRYWSQNVPSESLDKISKICVNNKVWPTSNQETSCALSPLLGYIAIGIKNINEVVIQQVEPGIKNKYMQP